MEKLPFLKCLLLLFKQPHIKLFFPSRIYASNTPSDLKPANIKKSTPGPLKNPLSQQPKQKKPEP